MAYNFPDSPTVGQVFEKWTWNGEAWVLTQPVSTLYVPISGGTMTGPLQVNSTLAVGGAAASGVPGDITAVRTSAPTTGYVFLGNATGNKYVGFDGASYVMPGGPLYTVNGRVWGNSDGTPLWLSGGLMTGQITTAPSQALGYGNTAGTIEVRASGAGDACMSFHRPGAFACNFGLGTDNNFYMGGWSFGASLYRFWTTRDFNYTPQANLGFTPVQQSGGAYQGANKIYIGWQDGVGLRLQVDASDQGNFAMFGHLASYVSNGRLPHAGDIGTASGAQTTIYDHLANGVVTGWGWQMVTGVVTPTAFRFRYTQGYTANSGWFTYAHV